MALGAGSFFMWPLVDAAKDQITVYPVMRSESGGLVPLNRSIYKVFPETQTVIYWMPDLQEVPIRLAKCSVRDRLHWKCEHSDGSAIISMDGGSFSSESESIKDRDSPQTLYTGRLEWWRLSF